MPATATRRRGRKPQKKIVTTGAAAAKNALNMIRGSGENKYTFYSCGVIEQARSERVPVRVIENGKVKIKQPRMVHRPGITETFSAMHSRADDGKYIAQSALSSDGKSVTGAHLVIPYLLGRGSYHTIVEAFHKLIGRARLSGLKAPISRNRPDGEYLTWQGKRTKEDAVVVSPWVTREALWNLARSLNPKLVRQLNAVQSQRKDVGEHLSSRDKFFQNLDVLRRARRGFLIATGNEEFRGGSTPYSLPLEQCGFAIDMFWLTTDVDSNGDETGGYFYRMVVGRSVPQILYRRQWVGLDYTSAFAYFNADVQMKAKRAATKVAA